MSKIEYERLETLKVPRIYPQITLTPVLEHDGDFVRLHHIDMEWPAGEGVEKYIPTSLIAKAKARQITVSNGMTGHAVCSACKSAIDPWDLYCRHCGAQIENPWSGE